MEQMNIDTDITLEFLGLAAHAADFWFHHPETRKSGMLCLQSGSSWPNLIHALNSVPRISPPNLNWPVKVALCILDSALLDFVFSCFALLCSSLLYSDLLSFALLCSTWLCSALLCCFALLALLAWLRLAWLGLAWLGLAWLGLAWQAHGWCMQAFSAPSLKNTSAAHASLHVQRSSFQMKMWRVWRAGRGPPLRLAPPPRSR